MNDASNADRPTWHVLDGAQCARRLASDPETGLSEPESRARLERDGANRLAEAPPTSALRVLARQFMGVMPAILGVAGVLALAVGERLDAAAIFVVLAINGVLGFAQERRAENALAALKSMLARRATVRRDGVDHDIDAAGLVAGDVILLTTGDRVPADGRLLETVALEIDESVLTGESVPVGKHTGPLAAEILALGDRTCMAYANTVVTRGRGVLLVTATGMTTETGRLAEMLAAAEETTTPLQLQLDRLGRRLAGIALCVVGIILAIALIRGTPFAEAALIAITLAVAAVPEGLPAVVTVTLALGMQRMARRGAIVKRLAAVETLGCATVVCSDKTGTLTLNRMTVQALFLAGRRFGVDDGLRAAAATDLERFLVPLALCNDARMDGDRLIGDPTEGALLDVATKGGIDRSALEAQLPRIAEVPFDSATKLMATFHRRGEDVEIFVKGAPDMLLGRCAKFAGANGDVALDDEGRRRLAGENESLAADALRIIAVATGRVAAADFDAAADLDRHLDGLVFIGMVGMIDPVRPEVGGAVSRCRDAGIGVKMVTGDHHGTATAIARHLGLNGDVVLGADVDAMDTETLAARIDGIDVFARVAPENKMRIVEALRARGHVVAMTGDGVNDAPALKHADIGMAMGKSGTDVTREAATMVLTDDNFATIVHAVEEGRTIYANIVKFVRFQLSTNMGALATVFTATAMGLPMPFSPIQLLWVNVIMDGPPAMALGIDPPDDGHMVRPPRGVDDQILTLRRFGVLAFLGAVMTLGTLGVFLWALEAGDGTRAGTLAFTTFVLFQAFNAFNARAETSTAFDRQQLRNPTLWTALAGVVVMQAIAVHWEPARAIMHTVPLAPLDWLVAASVAASILVLEEARKMFARRLPPRPKT